MQAFVWTNINSPAPLSFAVQKSIVDFKTQVIVHCGSAKCFIGTVTKVTDRNIIRVGDIPVRLTFVNTPERGKEGYSKATAFTSSICHVGTTALVDENDGQTEGNYDGTVVMIYCGGKMLNEELLHAGHAEIYTQFCNVIEFGEDGNQVWLLVRTTGTFLLICDFSTESKNFCTSTGLVVILPITLTGE